MRKICIYWKQVLSSFIGSLLRLILPYMSLAIEQSKIKWSEYNRFLMSVADPLQMSIGYGQGLLANRSPYEASVLRGTPYSGMIEKQSSTGSRLPDRFNSPAFIEILKSGDDQAFGELFRIILPLLVEYVLDTFRHSQYPLSKSDAEDVAQETLFRVERAVRAGRFTHQSEATVTTTKKSPAKFSTWIYTIAYNLACDRYKQLERSNEVQLSTQDSDAEGQSSSNSKKRKRAGSSGVGEDIAIILSDPTKKLHIEQILQSLKEKYRNILVSVFWDGYTSEEIAQREGVGVNTVHQWLARARKQFRQAYAKL